MTINPLHEKIQTEIRKDLGKKGIDVEYQYWKVDRIKLIIVLYTAAGQEPKTITFENN